MDLKALSINELHRRAVAARQVKGASEITLMFLLAELEDRQVYLDYGCSSISHYRAVPPPPRCAKARELARLGRVVGALPHLLEAFALGRISTVNCGKSAGSCRLRRKSFGCTSRSNGRRTRFSGFSRVAAATVWRLRRKRAMVMPTTR